MRPILFSIGPISTSSFGFFVAFAFLVAAFLIWKFSQEQLLYSETPIAEDTLFDAVFIFALGTLIGARIIFIFSHFDQFGLNLLRWVLIRQASGFSFIGGFLMGALLLLFFSLKKRIAFWDLADLFSLGGSAALFLCFLGAFLDGVGAGAKTTFAWGINFVGLEERRHPVQLLAAVSFLFLFLILKRVRLVSLKKRFNKGVLSLSFLSLSGLALFLLDFLKENEIYWKGLKSSQLLYLGVSLLGASLLYIRLGRNFSQDLKGMVNFLLKIQKIKERKA